MPHHVRRPSADRNPCVLADATPPVAAVPSAVVDLGALLRYEQQAYAARRSYSIAINEGLPADERATAALVANRAAMQLHADVVALPDLPHGAKLRARKLQVELHAIVNETHVLFQGLEVGPSAPVLRLDPHGRHAAVALAAGAREVEIAKVLLDEARAGNQLAAVAAVHAVRRASTVLRASFDRLKTTNYDGLMDLCSAMYAADRLGDEASRIRRQARQTVYRSKLARVPLALRRLSAANGAA